VDVTNGGCFACGASNFDTLVPDIFDDVSPEPLVLCGAISTYVSDKDLDCAGGLDGVAYDNTDQDWYEMVVPQVLDQFGNLSAGATVTITFASEFPAAFGWTQSTCALNPGDAIVFEASGVNGGLCTDSAFVAALDAGTWYLRIISDNLTGLEVGGTHPGHDYHVTIAPLTHGNPVPTVNDECADAILLSSNSSTFADNRLATENPADPFGTCPFVDPARHFGSIWYFFINTDETATVLTCNTPQTGPQTGAADSSLVFFTGFCAALVQFDCTEDACDPFLSGRNLSGLVVGAPTFISLGAWSVGDKGVYLLDVISP
jgi:hypothetical protein